ncbi:Dabb family protein [Aquimarina aggregata]|nr:Dabb family protein [Aquimarina aggregata]
MKFKLAILICLFISFYSVAQNQKKQDHTKMIKGKLIHTVFFWLNNPDNDKERKTFEQGVSRLLNECEHITSSHLGTPAKTTKRPVIDTSYTYCIVVTFESIKEHDLYQEDPIHLKFIEENKNLWKKVQIYDSSSL